MAKVENQKTLLKRLKKQVSALKRKEKIGRNKLRAALRKVAKLTRSHQSKLDRKAKQVKAKLAAAEAKVYAKLANAMKKRAKQVKKAKKAVKKALDVSKRKSRKRR